MIIGPSDFQIVRLSDCRTTSNRPSNNSYTVASVPLSCINECLYKLHTVQEFINLISFIFVLTVNICIFILQYFTGSKSLNPVRRPPLCPSMHRSQIKMSHPADETQGWNTDYTGTYIEKDIIPVGLL
jgi:hypothetical protein